MHTSDENTIIESIFNAIPDFKTRQLSFNHSGWSSVVVDVDDEHICKFPRNPEKYAHLKGEHRVLGLLQGNIVDVELPVRTHFDGDVPFFMHSKLKGDHFPLQAYLKAGRKEQHNFKNSIVDFLLQMHALNLDEFEGLIPVKNETLPPVEELHPVLEADFSGKAYRNARDILKNFSAVDKAGAAVVGHYDMHGYNIVVNPTKKLKGVFDFDEMAMGSREFDLRELPLNYNTSVGLSMIRLYNAQAAVPIDTKVLQAIHLGWCLNEYVRTKNRITGDLKDVDRIEMAAYRQETEQLLIKSKLEI